MAATRLIIDTIVSDPAIRGGRATLAGTRICVSYIVVSYINQHMSPEEIALNYGLSLGQVHSALAYYFIHKDEIDTQIKRDHANAEQVMAVLQEQGKLTILAE